ncbi:MAG: hypothetical protein Q8L81_05030 [Bacteroidota bacterium]|nr:hypothetical protein [Bacteroidota bacterium]
MFKKLIFILFPLCFLGFDIKKPIVAPKTIHVLVALCDNKYQGIVPVPAKIGNGQDLNNNLYWGCGYGVRSFFKKSTEWKLLKTLKVDSIKLERLVFKHTTKNYYLVADAYDGKYIKQCTKEFLYACSGKLKDSIQLNNVSIGLYGNATMLAYTGHDGLMDFDLTESFASTDNKTRDCIILACYSRSYFKPHLQAAKANPVVWTTGLMCPEAYTLHNALSVYVNSGTNEQVRSKAALTYASYQKCSEKAARNLLVTGW